MNEKKEDTDWSTWYSTYGLLTAERILERFDIHLPHNDLIQALKNPRSIYFHLLHVPMKNVFNGIIFRQVHDYQIYAQKLFVDYLLSGEDAKEKDTPGGETRKDIEQERLKLIETDEAFRKMEEARQRLIVESQGKLVELTKDIRSISLDPARLEESMRTYAERAADMNIELRGYRSQYYNLVLRITELLRLLTDYHIDQLKVLENRVALEFDALLGEE
jgi:hypothetical protein